jgi:hypothetical protein
MSGQPPKKDYLDKGSSCEELPLSTTVANVCLCVALEKLERMVGKKTGKNIDPNKYAKHNEKVTDKIRMMVEKATGKKVSSCDVTALPPILFGAMSTCLLTVDLVGACEDLELMRL